MISLIVPVYNAAPQLPRCIDSILCQSYTDFELLLIDDGSKDNSLQICREYEARDSRIHVYTHENSGVSATRNRGLQLAKGTYIMFADSDDYLRSDAMETLLRALESGNADVAICGLSEIGSHRQLQNIPRIQKTVAVEDLEQEYPEIFERYLINSPCNKLYKKSLITSGFQEAASMGEDLLFNADYLPRCRRFAFVKEPLYIYECLETGLVHKRRSDAIEIAHRLYLVSMKLKQQLQLGSLAEEHISMIFLKFLFHGLSQCYSTPELSRKEKKEVLLHWAADPDVRNALAAAKMPEAKQRLAQFLLRRRMTGAMHLMMCAMAWAKR